MPNGAKCSALLALSVLIEVVHGFFASAFIGTSTTVVVVVQE